MNEARFCATKGFTTATSSVGSRRPSAAFVAEIQSEAQSRRIRDLERDSSKKDKRLKEATALLELQKKVHALWGDEDDDTNKTKGAQ